MKTLLKTICLLLIASPTLFGQESNKVPFDPSVQTGVLENGMTYYIKHNEEPKNRASFYFAQNVGSILEKDSQRGLAHFLEHMAFNGTEHFEGKALLEYLEKNGIKFGSEINAFTSFDKTVYNISRVPTTNPQLLDSVLLALYDWSGSISLLEDEIDKERGVINEEWRTRNTASYRAAEKVWKQGLLKGSKYAERMPIGLMSVVNNFTYDELRDYYHKWYRPDLQALIIVGDIDVEKMEAKVKSLFSTIPLRENLPERKSFEVPNQKEELIFVESLDKELGNISLGYHIKNDAQHLTGKAYFDNALLGNIASYIINNRFKALTFNESCPALSISYSEDDFVRPLNVLSLNIRPRKGKIKEAFNFALTEFKRFVEYGATESELERAKVSIKNSYISYLKNKENISSDRYAQKLYKNFFTGVPFPTVAWKVEYILGTLGTISNADLIAYITEKFNQENKVLAVKGNSNATYPTKEAFVHIIKNVETKKLSKYEENFAGKKLINQELKGSGIKNTFQVSEVNAKGYELENGAKIVIYPTDYEDDKIYLRAFSKGGSSLLSKSYLPSVNIATYVASQSGLGQLNKIALDKKLAGTNTSLRLRIRQTSEIIHGSSTKTDIETLFKQLYLSFEAPRFDDTAFNIAMDRMKKGLARKKQNIKSEWKDSLKLAKTNHSERTFLLNEEFLQKINLEDAAYIYNNRFKNANDFTFVFVGDIDEAHLIKLAKKYIGSISSEQTNENYIDHNMDPSAGKTIVKISEEMKVPQTTVNRTFTGEMEYTPKNRMTMRILGELLGKRYLKVIREQEGGSYGVGAAAGLRIIPDEEYVLGVGFNCNPEMAEELIEVVYDEISRLQEIVDKEDLNEIKQSFIKSREEAQDENSYWLRTISNYFSQGTAIISMEDYVALVENVNEKDIKKAAKTIIKSSDVVEGVLSPI